jgi:hypothetical protein
MTGGFRRIRVCHAMILGKTCGVYFRAASKGLTRSPDLNFFREQDHLFARLAELLDVLVHDAADWAISVAGSPSGEPR